MPLEFLPGESRTTLGLTGQETLDIEGIADGLTPRKRVRVTARAADGGVREFQAIARVDTPDDVAYYHHGGLLPYVLRGMVRGAATA
jgi:aconitate hydratase